MECTHMNYQTEQRALFYMLQNQSDAAEDELPSISLKALNHLTDALDKLASLVDAEASRRVEKRL